MTIPRCLKITFQKTIFFSNKFLRFINIDKDVEPIARGGGLVRLEPSPKFEPPPIKARTPSPHTLTVTFELP